jgi:hypothetical protein
MALNIAGDVARRYPIRVGTRLHCGPAAAMYTFVQFELQLKWSSGVVLLPHRCGQGGGTPWMSYR